jgi:DNA-binding MarR family transcriptional regulator
MSTAARTQSPAAEAWSLLQTLMFDVQRPRFITLCSEFDMTPPQLMTLRRLDADTPVPTSEVARWLTCDASNVTGIVDRLEARGLVERRPDPGDRRLKMLALTDEGVALRDEIVRRLAMPPEPLAALPRADQRALRDILRLAVDRG